MPLRSGELARQSGVNLQSVRFYEREGLLPAPPRAGSGYRAFPESAVRRVRFIRRAQELGFSLAEIRELLSLRVDHGRDRSSVRALANSKLQEIDRKIASLEAMREALHQLAGRCTGSGPADECPILEAIDSQQQLVESGRAVPFPARRAARRTAPLAR